MIDDLMDYLKCMAYREGISFSITNELDSASPDISIPSMNKIILNERFDTSVALSFRFAHELSHILYGSDNDPYIYSFSFGNKNATELQANQNAVVMLVDFMYGDTPIEYRNWTDFMDMFGLPNWYEDLVKEAIYK